MSKDDEFQPRLGRIRATKSGKGGRYLQGVLKGVARANGSRTGRGIAFDGSRIGRGSGVGRVLRSRDRYAAFRSRRVVIQTRLIRLKRQSINAARLHLRYLQRDGVTREGQPGELYDANHDRADGREFLERGEGDRHQFRFIVSPEDGAGYDDLKPFVRRLMERMENDLGTRLDWVAVDHYNTAHPHTHVVLRGKDDRGGDLIIAREYIAHGMRERAAEIVSLDLGPRTDREIQTRLQQEVQQERLTSIDRDLLREVNENGLVQAFHRDSFQRSVRAGRLQKLDRLGMAEEVTPGIWRLSDRLERTLKEMGERGDIIKTIHRELAQTNVVRPTSAYAIHRTEAPAGERIVGKVLARGLADELRDRYYLIVDGVDGRTHYVAIGQADIEEPTREGAIVSLFARNTEARKSDRTIAAVAKANDGQYSAELHRAHDAKASSPFIEAHLRRLEDARRAGVAVERNRDGVWQLPDDYLERVRALEVARSHTAPVRIETLSHVPVERQVRAQAATWLDRELVSETPTALRGSGFGTEVQEALRQRRQWLIEQNLVRIEQDRIVYRAGLLAELRRRDLARAGSGLRGELGLPYAEAKSGSRIEGIYRRHVDLASGRFAVIERSRDFTLVPWRAVLERNLGKPVAGLMRGDSISWTIGRQRSGPSV